MEESIYKLTSLWNSRNGTVSIIGYNDIPVASYFTPAISTIRQDTIQGGIDRKTHTASGSSQSQVGYVTDKPGYAGDMMPGFLYQQLADTASTRSGKSTQSFTGNLTG